MSRQTGWAFTDVTPLEMEPMNSKEPRTMRAMGLRTICLSLIFLSPLTSQSGEGRVRSETRVLFLGDSITAAAQYVNDIETAVLLQANREPVPRIISLGLGSETASGLSEKSHPFPRPTVHERLDRVLATVQPDVVVACYGMNDGIYQPYSKERIAAYQEGVLLLITKAHMAGARVILLTPPPYAGKTSDAGESPEAVEYDYRVPFPAYDAVLAKYAEWIMTLDEMDGVETIDIRTPMLVAIAESYGEDPIHPNPHGHRVMATAVLAEWNEIIPKHAAVDLKTLTKSKQWDELHRLVTRRRNVYDRKLLWEIGHKRPGDAPKGTLDEAATEAARIGGQIEKLLKASRD